MNNPDMLPIVEPLEGRLLLSSHSALTSLMDAASAVDVPPAGAVSVSGQIEQPGETGVYAFTAQAKGRLDILMSSGSDAMDPTLRVYNSRGQLVALDRNARGSADSQLYVKVRAGQTYYVRTASRYGAGQFSLQLASTPADDYGNTTAAAHPWRLSSAGGGLISGVVNYSGDVDMFVVTAPKTGAMRVDFLTLGPMNLLAGQVTVLDSSGLAVTANSGDAGEGFSVSFAAQQGQKYYLAVTGASGSVGRYRLRSSLAAAPAPAPAPTPDPTPAPAPDLDPSPAISPGATVTAQVVTSAGLTQLLIIGTDGSDTITVSQTSAGVTVTTPDGSQDFAGAFGSVAIYGFGGDDVIRVTSSVTISPTIYTGAGNDQVFCAAQATGTIVAGDGDDLIVTVGAGRMRITGGAGMDSFWVNPTDVLSGVTAAETAAGAVHRVSQFYQPFTSSQSSPLYVPTLIAGQPLADPALTSAADGYANFSSSPLFVGGTPSYTDIQQGYLGDCYLLASLASLADVDPMVIEQMIAPMGDGTYAVRFYRNGREVYLRVDGDLPVSGSSLVYARQGDGGAIWAPLIEKAYAFFRCGQNSYGSIEGGWMSDFYQEATGLASPTEWTTVSASDLANYLLAQQAAGHAMTAASGSISAGPIVGSHAYEIKSVENTASGVFVTVYNPWGVDGRAWDSNPNDGLLQLPLALFQQAFAAVCVSMA